MQIDGSYGEGGGAILRQAIGLAAYAGVTVRITEVRAGRDKPGLRPQHLTALNAVAGICDARIEGAALGSTEVSFQPGPVRGGRFEYDIGTAGSVTLLLQALLVPCLCTRDEFEFHLVGGTDVPWSPPADYLARVTLPTVRRFGSGRLSVDRRGYYPKGGGAITVSLVGRGVPGDGLELSSPGAIEQVRGISHASAELRSRRVAERQAEAARDQLGGRYPVAIGVAYSDSYSPGSGITLWTESPDGPPLGGSGLGARGKPAEDVGREAARTLLGEVESRAAVDRHLADQLIPFLAVAGGSLRTSEITEHARSNMYIARRIVGAEFEVSGGNIRARR